MRLNACWDVDAASPPSVLVPLALAFAVWMLWSLLVTQLPAAGLRYSTNQLFWLAALPALSGATLQFVPPLRAHRSTGLTIAGLLLLSLGAGHALRNPDTPFEQWVALALACGVGAGLLVSARRARVRIGEQAPVVRSRPGWWLAWLVTGSVGTFIGMAAALPLFAQTQFPQARGITATVWLGPLLGVLVLPLGGRLAERFGAACVTQWAFVGLALGVVAWGFALPEGVGLFAGAAALLFLAGGIGSASTLRMFARVFDAAQARTALPLAGAVAAYGGFVVPKALGTALSLTGSAVPALLAFGVFHLSCLAITWWHHGRRFAPTPC